MQVRRQLEYSIAHSKGITLVRPPGTVEAVREIFGTNGLGGLYTGFRLHFSTSPLSKFGPRPVFGSSLLMLCST